jgi:hypothetical protein
MKRSTVVVIVAVVLAVLVVLVCGCGGLLYLLAPRINPSMDRETQEAIREVEENVPTLESGVALAAAQEVQLATNSRMRARALGTKNRS